MNINPLILSKTKVISAIIGGMLLSNTYIADAWAKNLDAGYVLNKMNANEQVNYITGVIEGLAYSRWLRDRPNSEGMKCIYNWYSKEDIWKQIDAFFTRHPDKSAGPLLYILTKKKCGA